MDREHLLREINRSQLLRGRAVIGELPKNWQVFYEEENGKLKGFVILYMYQRLTCEPDYNTGKVAEIELFTFPEYRGHGVCFRCIQKALEYGKENSIDIVADCLPAGYALLKKHGAKDSNDKRVWFHLS